MIGLNWNELSNLFSKYLFLNITYVFGKHVVSSTKYIDVNTVNFCVNCKSSYLTDLPENLFALIDKHTLIPLSKKWDYRFDIFIHILSNLSGCKYTHLVNHSYSYDTSILFRLIMDKSIIYVHPKPRIAIKDELETTTKINYVNVCI